LCKYNLPPFTKKHIGAVIHFFSNQVAERTIPDIFPSKSIRNLIWILAVVFSLNPVTLAAQCTIGCDQTATTNVMPGTNNFSNTFCITTASSLTYNQNFDMNGGTTCVGPNVTFSSGGGNWNGNWTVNNYGSFSRGITLNSGQVFNNYGNFTGSVSLNGGTVVNYTGATFTPSSFNFNGGSFTNNTGGTATLSSSVTVSSGATFANNGTLTATGLTLNSSATATLGAVTTINGSVTNNGTINIAGLVTVTGNYNQNSSGTMASQPGSQCNTLNTTGTIQGQGSYDGFNGLLLTQSLSPSCPSCLVNGTSTSPPGAPANQIAGATLTAAANSISGTITNPGGSPAPTHYIVLRRFGAAVSDQPTNYVNYAVGNTIGNSVVVAVNPIATLTFTDANVIAAYGCGTYHYAVFPYNVSGSCGTYNRTVNATNRSSRAVTSAAGTVGTGSTICSGSTSGTLTLTGYVGSIVRWESSVSPFSTWSTISNTSNTYTSGALIQTTHFRAVVNAGSGCSNVNATAAIITMDNIAPVITCPANQTINLDASCSATLPDYTAMPTVSDNCTPSGSITVTQSPVAGTALSAIGAQTIALTATDGSGNSANCTFTLTKLDVTVPIISCPANITTNATAGICGAVVNYTLNATDNCGGSACAPPAITGYILIGTLNGHTYFRSTATTNWATANANAIALGAHLVTISSTAENTFLSTAGVGWAGMSDQAAEGTWVWVTGEPVTFTGWNAGEPNNSGGNENYLHINFSVNGGWNDINGANSYPAFIEFDCITTNMVAGYASGSVFPVGTTTVTYNATDASGNTSSNCSFTITVNDVTPPSIVCTANISVNAADGACDAVVNYNAPVASDNCGSCSSAPAISGYTALGVYIGSAYYISNTGANGPAAFTAAAALGASVVTIGSAGENTFVRNAANSAGFTGSFLIGVNDVTTEGTFVGYSGEPLSYTNWNAGEPNNSGNEDYTQVLNTGLWNDIGAGSSGNYVIKISCITPVKTSGLASGSTFPVGVSTINYSATDPSGNTANCSFTVTVSVNPSSLAKTVAASATPVCINNGTNITVAASDNGVSYQLRDNATNTNIGSPVTGTGGTISLPTGNLTSTTTCNVYATGSSCSYQLTNTVTVTVNPATTVTPGSTLNACQSPTPAAITLSGASVGGSATTGAWSVTSGGGTLSSTAQTATPAAVTYTPAANYSGTVTLTLTTNDPAGPCGAVAATRIIIVNPLPTNLTPTAVASTVCGGTGTDIQIPTSQNGVNYQLRNNSGNIPVGSAVAGTGGTINLPTGNLASATTFNVLATNTTTGCALQMTTTVTVSIDNIAPVITCPATQTISLDASCAATLPDYTSLAAVSDNCTPTGSIVITQLPVPGTVVSSTGIQIITLTATDTSGNSSNCNFNLTKQDATPPVMSCPANITASSAVGICGTVVNYTVTASDNCSGASCAPASIAGYTLIGTYNGHTYFRSTTSSLWSTAKNNAQSLGAHLATISSAAENAFLAGLGQHWGGMTDEVAEGTWLWITGEPVTYTAWTAGEPNNGGGNQDYVVLNYSGTNWDDQGTTTSSSLPSIIEFDCLTLNLVAGYTSGSVFPVGTTTVTYNATDVAGNTSSNCSFTVTVNDVTPPSIVCPANISVNAAAGACDAVVNYNAPVASDNCGSCSSAPAISGYTALGVYNGSAYYISNAGVNGPAAFIAAASLGASVATITSAGENTFVRTAATSAGFTGSFLIGVNDVATEGTFAGYSGETLSYTNWNPGEPNNSGNEDYTQVLSTGLWNDIGAGSSGNYVIKISCITPVKTSGLASGSTFPVGVSTINYSATDPSANTANCSFTVTVSVNPTSLGKTVTAPAVCINNGTNVSIASSDNGISYQLRDNSNNANIGSPVTGTGGTISLPTGNLTTTTTYNVYATGSSCSYQLNNTVTVTVNPAATVTPGSTLIACQSPTPAAITLSGASVGGGATTGAWSITAGGGSLSSTAQTATPANITYTPAANYTGTVTLTLTTNDPAGPCGSVAATRTITVNAAPTNRTPSAAASSVCSGGATNIQIPTSQNGVNYQLRNNSGNILAGSAVAGTGGTINLPTGSLAATTTFNVLATNDLTGCTAQMTPTVTVTVSVPLDKTPTAVLSAVCTGTATNIQVTTSQIGVNYQLRNNTGNVNVGSAVAGTNGTINLPTGTLTTSTTFNVLATIVSSGCTAQMINTVTVNINAPGQWIGGATGNWNSAANWCGGIPTSSTNVNIPAGSTVNIQSANAVANSVTIAGTGSLVMTGVYNLNITAGGTFTNTGTFTATASTGTVAFLGSGTISGTTTFRNIDTYGVLDFGTAASVSGTFSLQTGGSVTGHSPTYICPTSTLLYRPGSTFSRGLEWTNSSSGAGYPANVTVQNNTTINFPAVGDGYICNDLTIDNGSSLRQDYSGGSAALRVGRHLTITGTLSLGNAGGGDIYLGGNWTRNTGGVFNANDRRVTFDGPSNFSGNGTSMSTITAPASAAKDNEGGFGGEKFAHFWVDKTNAADSVVLLSNITVTRELGFTRGTFSLRNSDVTLVSNSTRTADIAPITIPADISVRYGGSGQFVTQRFIQNPTAVRSWRLLTAPLQNATAPSINNAWQEGVVNPDKNNPNAGGGIYNPWPGYGTHITGPGGTYSAVNGFDQGTNSVSILYAGAGVSTWLTPSSTKATKITDRQGWMLFVRGDRGFTIGNQYTPSENTILEPKGRINTGNVAVPVIAGRQVIGNPYASAISLLNTDIAGTAGKNSSYHMWDPKMFTSYTQPGKWVSFTGVGNSFVKTTSESPYASNGTIESGQAFLIDAPVAGNVTFHETDKLALTSSLVGIANAAGARPMADPVFAMFRSDMFAKSDTTYKLTDAVVNIFSASWNNAADDADAKKIITFNTKESMSLLRDAVKLAIEKRADIQVADTVFYSLSKFNEIPYQFRFTASEFTPGMEAYLEDKFTGLRLPVSTNGATAVDFNITADPLSKAEDRFRVVFKSAFGVVLPVTFTNIKAWQQNENIAVEWKVENQVNAASYEVEKSTDGNSFNKSISLAANGVNNSSATYNWLDANAVKGMNYYRIKMIDHNGRHTYSSTAKVYVSSATPGISIYPNPIVNNTYQLQMAGNPAGSYLVNTYSSNGQKVCSSKLLYNGNDAVSKIMLHKKLSQGLYTVEIVHPDGISTTINVIVE